MKCQFIDNDDFFEEYILDRIDDAERQAFEGHLIECKACSEKLAQQEKMLAGIREVGRAEMKAEIKQQAELAGSEKFNWGAVTRIAALAFIFILTPTMYYVYKNQVQPGSAPLARQKTHPALEEAEFAEDISLDFEFSNELQSVPAEKEAEEETKTFQTKKSSNIPFKKESRLYRNPPKPKLSRQAPELQMQLKKKIAKEDSKTEQPVAQDLDEATGIDALSLEVAKFIEADEKPPALPENEPIPARLNSMSGAARFEERDSGISDKLSSSKFMHKDQSNIFSKTVTLNGRTVDLLLLIEPGAEARQRFNWPDEFPVSVTRPDSNRIILKGKFPVIQNISNADFSANGVSENEIEIRFGETAAYQIKIDTADSKAIRID